MFVFYFNYFFGCACGGQRKLLGVNSLLPSCYSQELNSGSQPWWQSPFPTEPSSCTSSPALFASFLPLGLMNVFEHHWEEKVIDTQSVGTSDQEHLFT